MPKQYEAQNPGQSYYDMLLAELMASGAFGQNQDALARGMASEGEDAKLRQLMGSKRKKRKGEQIPSGAYALSDYPGLRQAVDWAGTGNAPAGAGVGSHTGWLREQNDREYGDRMRQGRRDWASNQKELLGWRY
jgi:hypothetical protein